MPNRKTPLPGATPRPSEPAPVTPDTSGAQPALPDPTPAAVAPDTSTHISVRNTFVQTPDHRDVPDAPNLPWWRYAFPTLVDAIVAGGITHLLSAGKLHADWLQAIALVGMLLVAGVRAADLSSLVRSGQGAPPGSSMAALVGAGITAAAHVLVRGGSAGRVNAALLLVIVFALALLGLPCALLLTGGVR